MAILVTGAAGFIGYHVSEALLARGEKVIGVDSLNDYYDPTLKRARLARLKKHKGFTFRKLNLAAKGALDKAVGATRVSHVVHLAAQPGVRYSLQNPWAYIESNITGHLAVLEFCRHRKGLKHLVYASSSSVYGGNTKLPFAVTDAVDRPVSLYAATKCADELMTHTYNHLYKIPATGLRFFTVYGPWGRPDMAAWLFTDALIKGKSIDVFNNGDMRRDFTYIDDIVAGVLAVMDKPQDGHRVYNLGNHKSEQLLHFIGVLEEAVGKKAKMRLKPMQPGDVKDTYADIAASTRDFGFMPTTSIEKGMPKFVEWFKGYHKINR